MATDRDALIFKARLAEQAERYEEMVDFMKEAVVAGPELGIDERNLLSVGYKNIIGTRRASWRIVSSFENKEEASGNRDKLPLVRGYRARIEEELRKICTDVLSLLEQQLIPNAASAEAKVFYQKMRGDYNRYLAEFSLGDDRKNAAGKALSAYEAATANALSDLAPIHPIRLGLALNFSVFHCEILSNPDQACQIAKAAFDDAIAELDTLSEESYKDSTLIMQLLRDNLTLWTSEVGAAEYVEAEADADADADDAGGPAGREAEAVLDDEIQEPDEDKGDGEEVGDAEPAAAAAQ